MKTSVCLGKIFVFPRTSKAKNWNFLQQQINSFHKQKCKQMKLSKAYVADRPD